MFSLCFGKISKFPVFSLTGNLFCHFTCFPCSVGTLNILRFMARVTYTVTVICHDVYDTAYCTAFIIVKGSASFTSEPRPPLSKKSFPVSQVGKKKSQSGIFFFFFFPNFIFYKLECTGGGGGEVKQKKSRPPDWLILAVTRRTGNDFSLKDGLTFQSFLITRLQHITHFRHA